jgi:hypothetical protein
LTIAVAVLALVGCGGDENSQEAGEEAATVTVTTSEEATTEEATTEEAPTEEAPAEEAPAETPGQQNAREAAENYLSFSAFSRKGLIEQLKFEGYSQADAVYAVKAISPNWKEQAAKAAEQYLDTSSFSRSGLIEQLKFEGYSQAQAEYGVNKAYN